MVQETFIYLTHPAVRMKMFGIGFQSAAACIYGVTVKVTWPIFNLHAMLSNVAAML